jgi:hypothetical protein
VLRPKGKFSAIITDLCNLQAGIEGCDNLEVNEIISFPPFTFPSSTDLESTLSRKRNHKTRCELMNLIISQGINAFRMTQVKRLPWRSSRNSMYFIGTFLSVRCSPALSMTHSADMRYVKMGMRFQRLMPWLRRGVIKIGISLM